MTEERKCGGYLIGSQVDQDAYKHHGRQSAKKSSKLAEYIAQREASAKRAAESRKETDDAAR